MIIYSKYLHPVIYFHPNCKSSILFLKNSSFKEELVNSLIWFLIEIFKKW